MRGNAPTLIGCHGISDSLQPLDQVYEVRCSTWGVVKGCKDRWVVGCTDSLILGILWHDLYVQRVGCGKLNFAEKYGLHQQVSSSLACLTRQVLVSSVLQCAPADRRAVYNILACCVLHK
jgi:hypothetical protein